VSRRHVALFIRSLGGGGGAERMVVQLAGACAERGLRVDLVLGRREGHFLHAIPSGVRCVDLRGRSALGVLPAVLRDPHTAAHFAPVLFSARPPWVLGCVPALTRYLRRERPEALFSALNYSNLVALWARRLADVPLRLVISERNTLSMQVAHDRRRRERALPSLVRRFYPWADVVAAVSSGVADDLARVAGLPRADIEVIYNPVVDASLAGQAEAELDCAWFAPSAPPVILGVGKLKPQKDFPTLLHAFARLRAERAARLLILGQGPERRRLLRLARSLGIAADVALPGFVRNPFRYMARASVFVLSSAWEGLPGVLIQAMACGCPVVSVDCPSGPAEILESGAHGPLVPVGDAPALARAIARVLDAPPAAAALRARAADFSAERCAARIVALLLDGERPSGPPQPALG
jgi:glycosyltransferase involved in cell wall biosynthesis